MDETKARYATDREDVNTLEEALAGADMFLGLSTGDILQPEALEKMAKDPIVFALANPDPEIAYWIVRLSIPWKNPRKWLNTRSTIMI